jgi:hypothetical protein
VRETAAGVKRYVLGNFPEGARVEIQMVSREDLY